MTKMSKQLQKIQAFRRTLETLGEDRFVEIMMKAVEEGKITLPPMPAEAVMRRDEALLANAATERHSDDREGL